MKAAFRRFRILRLTIALLGYGPALIASDSLHIAGETMGTYYSIKVDTPAADDSEDGLRAAVDRRLAEINSMMSTWDDESEISGFNQSKTTDWFSVSAEFAEVVQEARRIHELSQGAFDPTVSPLIDLWGFGKPNRSEIPEQSAIDEALQSVGMQHVEVRLDPPGLRKKISDVQINLSAIAKGYAVDAVAELLTESGRPSFVVDIGGESRTGTEKAAGSAWNIGIESAASGFQQSHPPLRILPLSKMSIATSGDYRNYFEWNGIRYSHVIDPKTGWPVKDPPASVSVIHPSCMTADALATAMMVLGPEEGIRLANEQSLSVLFQTEGPDGTIAIQETGRFVSDNPAPSRNSSVSSALPAPSTAPSPVPWVPFFAAAVLFLIAVGGMAIGVLISNRQIKGSCGGLASMQGRDGHSMCELCAIPRDECVNEELRRQMQKSSETTSIPDSTSLKSED